MKYFTNTFNSLCHRWDRNNVFDDFITMSLTQFAFPSDEISKEMHRQAMDKYNRKEKDLFNKCFVEMLHTYEDELKEKKWFDFPGTFYEENIKSNFKASKLGQFFTPPHLCDLMSQFTKAENTNSTINDPCCGSGRNLLSFNSLYPGNKYVAQDIDLICIKMTVLNFLFHGMKGEVIWHDAICEPNEAKYLFSINTKLGALFPIPHYTINKNVTLFEPPKPKENKPKQLSLFKMAEK